MSEETLDFSHGFSKNT